VLGLKTLVRGAMTAAAVTGMTAQPARIASNTHGRASGRTSAGTRRRKTTTRAAQRKSAAKKSASA
jgi:hypothetical protein